MLRERIDSWVRYFNKYPAWQVCFVEVVVYMIIYSVPNHFLRLGVYPNPPYTYVDALIPFIDWTILIYTSVFLLIPVGLIWIVQSDRGRSVVSCIILLLMHLFFFLLYPVELSRIHLQPSDTWKWCFELMWMIDAPRNCFPSLHVAVSFIVAFFVLQRRRKWGWAFLVWAILVSLSTMTTEQHFFVDVVGGIVTSTVTFWLVFHRPPWKI